MSVMREIDDEMDAIFVPPTGKYKFSNNPVTCRYNDSVDCDRKTPCGKCGWNPAVAELRSQDIRRRLGLVKDKD